MGGKVVIKLRKVLIIAFHMPIKHMIKFRLTFHKSLLRLVYGFNNIRLGCLIVFSLMHFSNVDPQTSVICKFPLTDFANMPHIVVVFWW